MRREELIRALERLAGRELRRNSDESRRREQRRAGQTNSDEDILRSAIADERSDGQAGRLNRFVNYALWRVAEVMQPKNPAGWLRGRGEEAPFTPYDMGATILRSIRFEASRRPTWKGEGDPPAAIQTSVVVKSFQQKRPCYDPRHGEACSYDGCPACEEDCALPQEFGGVERYYRKVAAAFAYTHGDELALGIKATPTQDTNVSKRQTIDGRTNPFRTVFGDSFMGRWPGWEERSPLSRRMVPLDAYEDQISDVDEVRVWDNMGRTADRFTILMHGEVNDEPFYVSILSSASPTHPQRGIWMIESETSLHDAEGLELDPWQELLPIDVLNAIWEERGRSIVRVPREIAERWATLTLGNYWS